MPKLVLSNLVNLQNETSAVNTINNNSAATALALENTLSRDGSSPNAMESNLDMNSNRVLNLPEALEPTEPLRKQEAQDILDLADSFEEAISTVDEQIADATAEIITEVSGYRDETQTLRDETEAFRNEAEAAADNFDDVYLGSKNSDPTLDNDGDPLVEGQLYWNSVGNNLRIYDGATWQAYSASSGLTAVVDDSSPSLGGDLDLNGHVITGLEIGTDVQAYDSDLDAWAAVNPSSYLTTSAASSTYQPLDSDLTSWAGVARASGFDTFVATPSSANLRSLLTDETGTGIAYFVGGALGTPASGTLTNAAGLPAAGVTGTALVASVENQTSITGGAEITSKSLGTITTGTVTVDLGDRSLQHYTNNGAHTLAASGVGETSLLITNAASAGTITSSGFDIQLGDPFDTTSGHKFAVLIRSWGSGNLLKVVERIV